MKAGKALEIALAKTALLEKELETVKAAQAIDKATQGSRKDQRVPTGQFLDPEYQAEREQELADRKVKEREAIERKKAAVVPKRRGRPPKQREQPEAGPSTSV